MTAIRKVLIANRGEIALRIIRSCREMGIATVAVYSDVDRRSPHVLAADEAYHIGPATAAESYLKMDTVLDVARRSGAEAIHPGYGFLAENPEFSRRVSEAGLIFVGPGPDTIRLMGSKTASRQAMIGSGVPVVPGAKGAIESVEEARALVEGIGGYPVLIKAAAGGGGKGMRTVFGDAEFERSWTAARNEAQKAFGDPTLYIEKFVENPKHIEIQVIADRHGNVLHLWERDCSIQRRHQKVVEECPSAVLSSETRAAMGEVAVQAARACDYVNAGTVEFLYDADGNFYFLEMNTRLQVEHPVTEIVMGVDLVKMQMQVAAGEPLPLSQEEVVPRGHAIECRINAEDVFHNFVPATGQITHLKMPEGPGVRLDSGVDAFSSISRYYDPMIAKLIVHGSTREEAIDRTRRALEELELDGVPTTIPFCLAVMDHPEFQDGSFTTKFVEKHWEAMKAELQASDDEIVVVAAAITHALETRQRQVAQAGMTANGQSEMSPWKMRTLIKS